MSQPSENLIPINIRLFIETMQEKIIWISRAMDGLRMGRDEDGHETP